MVVRYTFLLMVHAMFVPSLAAQDRMPFDTFQTRRIQLSQRATRVLGGWAVANLGAGAAVRAHAGQGSEAWHFGNMTQVWQPLSSFTISAPLSPSCRVGTFRHSARYVGHVPPCMKAK